MAKPVCEGSVRSRAARLRVDIGVVETEKGGVRWWAVTSSAMDALRDRRPMISRHGDASSFESAWRSIDEALRSVFGDPR